MHTDGSGDHGVAGGVGPELVEEAAFREQVGRHAIRRLRVGPPVVAETADLEVTRHLLPNLRAVNFVIEGILGEGVAYQARFDPQAKGLGEWLRSRHIDISESLLT